MARLAPLLRPAGLTGLGVFAALQINLVSFAAPMATLTMMESRGASDRHLAATLAMVMAMAQANVTFPMAAMGLAFGPALLLSLVGGVVAAAADLPCLRPRAVERRSRDGRNPAPPRGRGRQGRARRHQPRRRRGFKISIGAIPMLVLALVAVMALRASGAIDLLTGRSPRCCAPSTSTRR